MKLLFRAESELVIFLKKSDPNQNSSVLIKSYLKLVDFDEKSETDDYVKHPINAFHLLQRTSQWIPKLMVGKSQKVFLFCPIYQKIDAVYFFENEGKMKILS